MTDDLKELPPPEKKVAAKVLTEAGYSSRRLEDMLGMDNVSIWRASQEATPDDLKQFETDFQIAIGDMKKQGVALVQKRLLELIPKERRIDQVVKAGEYLEGKTQTLQQINVGSNMGIEFIKADATSKTT